MGGLQPINDMCLPSHWWVQSVTVTCRMENEVSALWRVVTESNNTPRIVVSLTNNMKRNVCEFHMDA